MKISIITVSYNSAKTIEDTIKSVLSQTYPDIEYIIIDGGSTDGTLEIIKKYRDKIAKFISEPDKGLFDALNKGIKMATGEIVGILHSDDFYADGKIIESIAGAMAKQNADVCWGDLVYVDRNDIEKAVRYWKSSSYKKGKFKKGWMPPHPTFFAKKELFEKYGYYKLEMRMAADYELMLRFMERYGVKTCYLPRVLTKMRIGGVSNRSFKNLKIMIRGNIDSYRAWKINDLKGGWLVPLLKPLSKIFQRFKKSPSF